MKAISLRIPQSLHQAARELADREGISVNQLVATALAEKVAALMTVEYLERAKRGSRKKFLAAMARVPNVEPELWDVLPEGFTADKQSAATKPRRRAKKRRAKK